MTQVNRGSRLCHRWSAPVSKSEETLDEFGENPIEKVNQLLRCLFYSEFITQIVKEWIRFATPLDTKLFYHYLYDKN